MKLLLSSVRLYRAELVRGWSQESEPEIRSFLEDRIRCCNQVIVKLVQEAWL